MASACPVCLQPLPDESQSRCPNCGADLLPPPLVTPETPRAPFGAAPAAPAPDPGAPIAAPTPGARWEERQRIGFFVALVETTRDVLLRPQAFFRAMNVQGGIASPLLYAVIVGWCGVVVASFYQALFRSLVGPSVLPFGERPELAAVLGLMEGWVGFFTQLAFGGVVVAISVFVSAGVLQLMLLLLGGAERGFEATIRTVCYAQATSVLLVVPFCGQFVAVVWLIVLYVIGLAAAQRIGHGKAAAAVLLPILLLCCCCAAVIGLAMGAAGFATQMR